MNSSGTVFPEGFAIGVDIEDISRFRAQPFEGHENFYRKLFTDDEIAYCLSKKDPYPSFAVRFCAKEASMKATGETTLNYHDFEVIVNNDRPAVVWKGVAHALSLSHDKDKAIAFAIITKK